MAAALLVEPGERVLVAGGPGVVEALQARGVEVVVNDGTLDRSTIEAAPFDAVVTGLHRDFDYPRLRSAAAAVHVGARLIGTNSDPTYPTPAGLDPGGGSILAADRDGRVGRAGDRGQAVPADGIADRHGARHSRPRRTTPRP